MNIGDEQGGILMSGHSKWSTIKHKKGKADAARGKVFTKIAREIIIAARAGGGDPNANPRLRAALDKAREANMPNDNINRAIRRGTGEIEGAVYEEMVYEGYGPGGSAVLLELTSDNRNRTAGEIRYIFSRNGGSLGESGCVAWMFDRKGLIVLEAGEKIDEDEIMMLALDAGAEDVTIENGEVEITTAPDDLEVVKQSLLDNGLQLASAELTRIPKNTVELDGENAVKMLKLMELLEEHDDVQEAYSNFDISDELMEQLDK